MSRKVTVIADKDTGTVLGAVAEVNAEAALGIPQVVAGTGLPMRKGVPVTLEVPPGELMTHLAAGDGPLFDPHSYVVVDGVPIPSIRQISSLQVKPNRLIFGLGVSPPPEVKVKAITRRRSDGVVEVFAVSKINTSQPVAYGVTLRAREYYDVLVLVEAHQAHFEENKQATP